MSEAERQMDAAGLRPEPTGDLTALTLPGMRARLQPPTAAQRAFWTRQREGDPRRQANMGAHMAADRACARAMIDGDFLYVRYAATKPSR